MNGFPKKRTYKGIMRILGLVMMTLYVVFLINETFPEYSGKTVDLITTYALFIVFAVGLFYQWKNLLVSAFIWIIWYALLWVLVLLVWDNAGITILMGLPIFVLAILELIYGRKGRKAA